MTKQQPLLKPSAACIVQIHVACQGCPVHIGIPHFIEALAEGNLPEAAARLKKDTSLPAVCGRVCPQENQCEGKCVLGIKGEPVAIGRLERLLLMGNRNPAPKPVDMPQKMAKKLASSALAPAGLACAGNLAKMGYDVTVFEPSILLVGY